MGRMEEHDESTAFATPEQVVAAAHAAAKNANGGGSSSSGAGGSSSSAAAEDASPPAPIGMPLLLSQIQEWYVEGPPTSTRASSGSAPSSRATASSRPTRPTRPGSPSCSGRALGDQVHARGRQRLARVEVSFEDIVKEVVDVSKGTRPSPRARGRARRLCLRGPARRRALFGLPRPDRPQPVLGPAAAGPHAGRQAVAQCVFAQTLRSKMLRGATSSCTPRRKAALKAMAAAARKASAKSAAPAARRASSSAPTR